MRDRIKQILKESDFGWAKGISGLPSWVSVKGPKKDNNPRNMYRLTFNLQHGYDWQWSSGDWVNIAPNHTDLLRSIVYCAEVLHRDGYDDGFYYLVRDYIERGKTWIIHDAYRRDIEREVEKLDADDEDDIYEIVREYLSDYLRDYSLLTWDESTDDYASISNTKLWYFDENGIQHELEIDYDRLENG